MARKNQRSWPNSTAPKRNPSFYLDMAGPEDGTFLTLLVKRLAAEKEAAELESIHSTFPQPEPSAIEPQAKESKIQRQAATTAGEDRPKERFFVVRSAEGLRIYDKWEECLGRILDRQGIATFKSFPNRASAEDWAQNSGITASRWEEITTWNNTLIQGEQKIKEEVTVAAVAEKKKKKKKKGEDVVPVTVTKKENWEMARKKPPNPPSNIFEKATAMSKSYLGSDFQIAQQTEGVALLQLLPILARLNTYSNIEKAFLAQHDETAVVERVMAKIREWVHVPNWKYTRSQLKELVEMEFEASLMAKWVEILNKMRAELRGPVLSGSGSLRDIMAEELKLKPTNGSTPAINNELQKIELLTPQDKETGRQHWERAGGNSKIPFEVMSQDQVKALLRTVDILKEISMDSTTACPRFRGAEGDEEEGKAVLVQTMERVTMLGPDWEYQEKCLTSLLETEYLRRLNAIHDKIPMETLVQGCVKQDMVTTTAGLGRKRENWSPARHDIEELRSYIILLQSIESSQNPGDVIVKKFEPPKNPSNLIKLHRKRMKRKLKAAKRNHCN